MRSQLLLSIASTLADYRLGEIPAIDAAHVNRWVSQFPVAAQGPMLEEIDHIFKITYFSNAKFTSWMSQLATSGKFVGPAPCAFWQNATILALQSQGCSQTEVIKLVRQAVSTAWGVGVGTGSAGGAFLYLDDFVFTGNTALADLRAWIVSAAPNHIDLRVVAIAVHRYGAYYLRTQLEKIAKANGKTLSMSIWSLGQVEDRKAYVDDSEVFRPTRTTGNPLVQIFASALAALGRPPVLRPIHAMPKSGLFKAPASRDVLEWELLCAGAKLRAGCASPTRVMRPMGFSSLDTLGFGATVLTYRNCPNNAPLALWWGNPKATSGPLAWYPLLPRRSGGTTFQWAGTPLKVEVTTSVSSATADIDDDDFEMPWESAANAAVTRMMASLEINVEDGVARVDVEGSPMDLDDIEDLRTQLEIAYDEAWYGNVPFESGEAVFQGDATNAIDDALTSVEAELATLGWEL